MDLFGDNSPSNEPLAARMRPRNLAEYIGQEHIVGPGRLLRRAIDADQLSSLIFYGPPGTGKTTLARVIAGSTESRFVTLNAVLAGVADIRREIAAAGDARNLHEKRSILFVDEVHRWNKSQQDALLPWVENGTVILVGATTENPYFEVNKALVSRSRVFQLKSLEGKDLIAVARQALANRERGYGKWAVDFEEGALEHLVNVSSGDARSLLNALQLAVETSPDSFPPPEGAAIHVSLNAAEESIQRKAVLYDREGDYHFDTISAFIKSIRGSDPDAALYWMALMIRAGEDPRFIFRRLLISACEDVGLAAPEALGVVESCAAAFDRVGLPEGQFHLTHAALYLATAPKSNSSMGYFDALRAVDEEKNPDVPNHLRDGSRDKHAFGHGEGYKYPHAWREHWTAQQYLPDGLSGRIFYRPGELGHEGSVRETVLLRREEQLTAMLDDEESAPGEVLRYSPGDDERDRWVRRTESSREPQAVSIRNLLLKNWKPLRHHRILIVSDPGGALTREAHRKVPEGGVASLCSSPGTYDALSWMSGGLPAAERPTLLVGTAEDPDLLSRAARDGTAYEWIMGRNALSKRGGEARRTFLNAVNELSAPGGKILLAEPNPGCGTLIGHLIPEGLFTGRKLARFQDCETELARDMAEGNNARTLRSIFEETDWTRVDIREEEIQESRILAEGLLSRRFSTEAADGYGSRMAALMGADEWSKTAAALKAALIGKTITWRSALLIIRAEKT